MKLRINARWKHLLQVTRKEVRKVHNADCVNPVDLSRSESLPLSKPDSSSKSLSLDADDSLLSDSFTPCTESAQIGGASASQNTQFHEFSEQSDKISEGELSLHPFFQDEVEFLHQIVKDFFQVKDVQRFIASRISEIFDSCALLCRTFLAQIKAAPVEKIHSDRLGEL